MPQQKDAIQEMHKNQNNQKDGLTKRKNLKNRKR